MWRTASLVGTDVTVARGHASYGGGILVAGDATATFTRLSVQDCTAYVPFAAMHSLWRPFLQRWRPVASPVVSCVLRLLGRLQVGGWWRRVSTRSRLAHRDRRQFHGLHCS